MELEFQALQVAAVPREPLEELELPAPQALLDPLVERAVWALLVHRAARVLPEQRVQPELEVSVAPRAR